MLFLATSRASFEISIQIHFLIFVFCIIEAKIAELQVHMSIIKKLSILSSFKHSETKISVSFLGIKTLLSTKKSIQKKLAFSKIYSIGTHFLNFSKSISIDFINFLSISSIKNNSFFEIFKFFIKIKSSISDFIQYFLNSIFFIIQKSFLKILNLSI
jgi:hypothetical protein